MTDAGAIVHYYSADVRDENEFGGLLDNLQRRFGPLAGVIHGAGVIEDRLVKDKTPESFDRIFQTKVVGARILTERLDPARLKFCAFFASVASRFGNKGQSDYAAANEVLSKLALLLDRRWPGPRLLGGLGPLVRDRHGRRPRSPPGPARPSADLSPGRAGAVHRRAAPRSQRGERDHPGWRGRSAGPSDPPGRDHLPLR